MAPANVNCTVRCATALEGMRQVLVSAVRRQKWRVLPRLAILAFGVSLQALPEPAISAEPEALLSTCTFDITTLKNALTDGDNNVNKDNWVISYIVVYARENPSGGQVIETGPDAGAYTGPVLCVNGDGIETVESDAGTVPIPNAFHHPGVETIDILESQEALILRYQLNDDAGAPPAGHDGEIENRFCHSSAGNVDCVIQRDQTNW